MKSSASSACWRRTKKTSSAVAHHTPYGNARAARPRLAKTTIAVHDKAKPSMRSHAANQSSRSCASVRAELRQSRNLPKDAPEIRQRHGRAQQMPIPEYWALFGPSSTLPWRAGGVQRLGRARPRSCNCGRRCAHSSRVLTMHVVRRSRATSVWCVHRARVRPRASKGFTMSWRTVYWTSSGRCPV